ncbi:MAG: glycosyltransferase family 2 protein [Paludibacteraceae bacterium]|nr:glycosyltransferase family 2 protein [Paludibacteraceae bacterium]
MQKVYTIVVTYNASKWVDKCFSSLISSKQPTEIIVIDNNSNDNTAQKIKDRFPHVEIIEAGENLGFAKANNIGIKLALEKGTDFVFLLNQDAWIEPDTIENLIQSFKGKNNVGIVSPIHLNGSGNALDINFSFCMPSDFTSDGYLKKLKPEYTSKMVNAAAWLVSAECLRKIGGFDTLLFTHYGEDDNYCQRLEYHGYKLIVNTEAKIHHDRENRGDESKYRDTIWKSNNADLMEKVNLGNINLNVDIDRLIKIQRIKYLKNLILLRIRRLKRIRQKILLYQQINESRYKSVQGGLVWLNS